MSDYFPQEILVDILLRLPPKCVVKCTAVCKSWRNLITHSSFIHNYYHLPHSPTFFLLQLFHNNTVPPLIHRLLRRHDPLLSPSGLSLRLPHPYSTVLGICHGLLCINTLESNTLFICNPSVRRYVTLPDPQQLHRFYISSVSSVGFGFDSRNNDYKVVWVCNMMDTLHVEVYSLADGFWKDVSAVAPPLCKLCCTDGGAPHGFVDGIIHWAVKRMVGDTCYYFVLSFYLEDEMFGEVLLPGGLVCESMDNVTVIGGGGKDLAVYHFSDFFLYGHVWVMKEYGVLESWTKVCSFNMLGMPMSKTPDLPRAICVRDSGDVLFLLLDVAGEGTIYSLDVETTTLTDLQFGDLGYVTTCYLYSGYYKESLYLLDKASGVVSY